jgi:amidophosphoribosyltransferase
MSKMKDFVAFQALIELLCETQQTHLIQETYLRCKASENLPVEMVQNEVIPLYNHFAYTDISNRIAHIVTPKDINVEVQVIFQTLEALHNACPKNKGDWYFSGRYPTPGGNRVANRAFINFVENRDERAY